MYRPCRPQTPCITISRFFLAYMVAQLIAFRLDKRMKATHGLFRIERSVPFEEDCR